MVDLYEEEAEGDSEEVRGQRFEKIMLSMQKVSFAFSEPGEEAGGGVQGDTLISEDFCLLIDVFFVSYILLLVLFLSYSNYLFSFKSGILKFHKCRFLYLKYPIVRMYLHVLA